MKEYYVETANKNLKDNGIEFFLQKYNKDSRGPSAHIHPAVEVIHIVQGLFRFQVDDKEFTAGEGETVLIRSNSIHTVSMISPAPGAYHVIKFLPEFLLGLSSPLSGASYLLDLSLSGDGAKILWSPEESASVAETALELEREAKTGEYGSDIAVKLAVARVALILLRSGAAQNASYGNESLLRRVYDAIVFINSHYGENISAAGCAEHVFLSYSYFSRSFRRVTGKTFSEHLTLTRVNHAAKELLSSDKSVAAVSLECGFENPAYFGAVFKRLKGASPSEFRKRAGEQA